MTSLKRLAFASTLATFLLVAIGGLVRATRSGLGCGTDWPDCSGAVIPYFGSRAVIIEFSHRLMASVVVILLATLALMAWRRRGEDRRIMRTAVVAFLLVMFQAVLGAIVVWLELKAESVVLHLATAMTLVGVLVYLSFSTAVADGSFTPTPDDASARRARIAAGLVLILLLVGSYVSGRDAGYVFQDWPLMNGEVVPDLSFEPAAIHFLHRALALGTGIVVFVIGIGIARRRDELPLQAKLAHSAMGLFALQVLLGAANVWNPPPGMGNELLVTAHLLVGASIWALLVATAVASLPSLADARARRALSPSPAYEAGA